MSTNRAIRVFISSTFRDMQAERDYLVKFTFPQLRKLCESRGVTWGEVDLRWGITDEERAEGKVLPLCLEEIRRCRPYFIGLLGERYGWIPDDIPPEVVEREVWLHEHVDERKSVTELEILHGVLNNPKMANHAFFYFRDPKYVEALPHEQQLGFASEDPESAKKLNELKDRIRHNHFPVRENYAHAKALGELVLKDFTELIDLLFPEDKKLDPLDREAADHKAFAQSRGRVYIGRQEYSERLDAHVDRTDPPLVVLGASGIGKSALLANWSAKYREKHPDACVIEHYIGATPYSADWAAMLRRIMGEFKRHFDIQQDIPDKPDELPAAFANSLHMAAAKGKVIIILDALNQLEDRDGAPELAWLPPVIPVEIKLIVSTLTGRALEDLDRRGWPTLVVKPLDVMERNQLITEYLAQDSKSLSPARAKRIAMAPQSANPLYLRVLLDELRGFGVHEKLDERIAHYLGAASPYELYERVIVRWEQDYEGDSDLVGDSLSLLWASRRGLSETELLHALGHDSQPLPRAIWSPLGLAMSDGLVSRGGLLNFSHDFLREASRDCYLPEESHQREAHLRLADYFESESSGPRCLDELPWQLVQGEAWERLHSLMSEHLFFKAAWVYNQIDIKRFWAKLEASSQFRITNTFREVIDRPENEEDSSFVSRLSEFLHKTGHPGESLALQRELAKRARANGELDVLQANLGNQALILRGHGEHEKAMALHREEESICRQLGDSAGLRASLISQANILYECGDLDGAMALHLSNESACRQSGDIHGLQRSLEGQALILKSHGDLEGAMALHQEEERICRESGNLGGLQTTLNNQANVLQARGDLAGALALYRKAEKICRELSDLRSLSFVLGNQGSVLASLGNFRQALLLQKETERICRRWGDVNALQGCLVNQAATLYRLGDLHGAIALHKEVEQICRRLSNQKILSLSLGNQALIFADWGDTGRAMSLLEEQEAICRQTDNVEGLTLSLANKSQLFAKLGQPREGIPFAEEAYQLATTHGYRLLSRQIGMFLDELRQAPGAEES